MELYQIVLLATLPGNLGVNVNVGPGLAEDRCEDGPDGRGDGVGVVGNRI